MEPEQCESFLDGHTCEVVWSRTFRLGRVQVNLTWMRLESFDGQELSPNLGAGAGDGADFGGRELSFHLWWEGRRTR